jgi:hypothetical protein
MTLSFGPHNSPSDRPPRVEKAHFVTSNIAQGDTQALATILASSLEYLALERWRAFDISTKRALAELRLITRPQFATRYKTTIEFNQLYPAIKDLPLEGKAMAMRAILAAHEQFGSQGASITATHIGLFSYHLRERFGGDTSTVMTHLRKLTLAYIENKHLGLNLFGGSLGGALEERSRQIMLARAMFNHFTTRNPDEQTSSLRYLREEGQHNDVPFLDHAMFEEIRRETREHARNVIVRSLRYGLYAFDRLSAETRRPAPGAPCLFQEFGKEAFDDCFRLHTTNNDRTPGPGYYLSGAKADALFFGGKKSLKAYQESFATYGKAFEQFQDTTYFFMRGGIVVFHRGEEYRLPVASDRNAEGHFSKTEPYCLYIANDHFTGGIELAALLPARIVQRHLMPAIHFDDGLTGETPQLDLSQPGFNLDSLVQASTESGVPPLLLANISTGFGGLVAAYPKGSAPYYTWEEGLDKVGTMWRDGRKRVHHAWYVRSTEDYRYGTAHAQTTRARIELLKPLAEGCSRVATAAEGLLNLLDLFTFRYDAWKVDLTPQAPQTRRMLRAALHWHHSLHARGASEREFPFLCKVNRYNWNQRPEIVLDTHSCELNLGDGRVKKIPTTPGGQELAEMLWGRHVAPLVTFIDGNSRSETDSTLVFLPRDLVV